MQKKSITVFLNSLKSFFSPSGIIHRGVAIGIVCLFSFNIYGQTVDSSNVVASDSLIVPLEPAPVEVHNEKSIHEQQEWRPIVTEPQLDKAKQRTFDSEKLKDYVNDNDYQYDIKQPSDRLSWWERFKMWLFEKLFSNFDSVSGTRNTLKIILIIISGALLVFAIIKFIGADPRSLFGRKSKTDNLSLEEMENDIHSISFDELIADAVEKQQYKRAVRLFYLKSLKQLSDREWIEWQPYKTNYEYVRELKKNELLGDFRQVTYLFEYIWYGDFKLDQTSFKETEEQFVSFEKKMRVL